MQQGAVNPYLIWPNINPFRKQKSHTLVNEESTLSQAREWVQTARTQQIGVFDQTDPLRLQAFELRFLAQRHAPSRWVIDLSRNDNTLIHPEE